MQPIYLPPRPHLVLDFHGCDPARLDDAGGCRDALYGAARDVGARTIGDFFHRFSPHGVTGVVAIAESHISIHTWVEERFAAVDLFLCNSSLTPPAVEAAVARIHDFLGAKSCNIHVMQRGAAAPAQKAGP